MLRLKRYERISVQNRRFPSNGGRLTQNFRWKGSSSTNHSSQKTRLNDLSYGRYGIKISTDVSSVLSQCTRLTLPDRRTDGRTEFSSLRARCGNSQPWLRSVHYANGPHDAFLLSPRATRSRLRATRPHGHKKEVLLGSRPHTDADCSMAQIAW